MKGVKLNKQDSLKSKVRELEVALQNTQMALQVSQMMIKHLTDQFKATQNDLSSTMGMLNDFQYRTLAMLEVGNFDRNAIEEKAEAIKLLDFNKASDKDDELKGYVSDDSGVITEDSVVTITSHTPDLAEDQGIFRSKFPMSECLSPQLRQKLLGLKLNDSVKVDLNGAVHDIKILSIKKVVKTEEASTQEG
jgi:hypothetical protein